MIYFLGGGILGFLFWTLFAGKYEGDGIERSIRPNIGGYRLHIHHWIWCSFLAVGLWFIESQTHVGMFGFFAGSITQGLTYNDRFVIMYRGEDFEKIYSRFGKLASRGQ